MHEIANGSRIVGERFFDSDAVQNLIVGYQESGSSDALGEIILKCEPIALSLIRSRCTMLREDEDELMSIVNRKLLVILPQYNPTRGTAFSFVSRLTINMLATTVTHRRKLAHRYPALDKTLLLTVPDDKGGIDSAVALDDLVHQIRSIKSPLTVESEREAQRCFTESFLDCGFELRRHECADAAMAVYALTLRRSRQTYDLTLLSIRRVLWDETKHAPVTLGQLRGTKGWPVVHYSNFLTPEEFAKFVALMKDLAPSVVVSVRPANEGRIRSGC